MKSSAPDLINTRALAILALFLWLVPHIFIQIAEYRVAIIKSSKWEGEKLTDGLRAIMNHSLFATAVGLIIVSGTAAGVALSTKGMDIDLLYILSGLSRLCSAMVIFLLSFKIPVWLSIYHEQNLHPEPLTSSLKSLRFNVRWSIWKCFFTIYFILLPFFCGAPGPIEIPVYIIVGIIGGILVCLGVYYGRTKCHAHKKSIAIIMVVILAILSALNFAFAFWYIEYVWFPEHNVYDYQGLGGWAWWACAILIWLVIELISHFVFWRWSKKKFREEEEQRRAGQRVESALFNTAFFNPKNFVGVTESNVRIHHVQSPENKHSDLEAVPEVLSEGVPIHSAKNDNQDNETAEPQRPMLDQSDTKVVEQTGCASQTEQEEEVEETTCDLIKKKICCCWCCLCGYPRKEITHRSMLKKIFTMTKWTVWTVASCLSLYVTIVNIGATKQVHRAMEYLPMTDKILYQNLNEGPVCAFLNTGKGKTYDVRTFHNSTAARAINYTIAHCGSCGACSSWDNLKLQWTTRSKLARTSQNCAKKAGISGSFDAAVQCHMDTIGFDEKCSICWVKDEICARKNCVFIYLQAVIINHVFKFAVSPNAITSATCEEAMCELEFVPCVGATRRRMHIGSDIARPANQECTNVNESQWVELFGP